MIGIIAPSMPVIKVNIIPPNTVLSVLYSFFSNACTMNAIVTITPNREPDTNFQKSLKLNIFANKDIIFSDIWTDLS